ncbi:MAG: universal stress protein [Anaerolineae bacterium]|jgi:nucleotide-binding universal stress UspA family protein
MTEFKRILVPLDGSPFSERALPVATSMAQKYGSEIILLRVLDIPVPTPPTSHPEVTIGWVREARAHAHREAQSYLDAWQQEVHRQGIEVHALMRDRSPGEDILQVAGSEKVDLIVMSAHGQGGLARWTFGGVADKVARHSPCPVLLVRYAAPAGAAGEA